MDRREQDRQRTRTAILDAAEALMREEGYAAVTSRKVAERAGLKSQLVHYHFGTMDELFQAAYRRNDQRFFEIYLNTLAARNPLEAIWKLALQPKDDRLILEYIAAANHRKILREELVQSWSRFGSLITTVIANFFEKEGIDAGEYSPQIIAFLITSVSKALIEESHLEYTRGHEEVIAFMDALLTKIQGRTDRQAPAPRPIDVAPGKSIKAPTAEN